MAEQTRFAVGQGVKWASQSQGAWKEKRGTVTEIVPAGQLPDRERYPSFYTGAGLGSPRPHDSYIIRVLGGKTKKARPKFYWPIASKLEAIPLEEVPRVL